METDCAAQVEAWPELSSMLDNLLLLFDPLGFPASWHLAVQRLGWSTRALRGVLEIDPSG